MRIKKLNYLLIVMAAVFGAATPVLAQTNNNQTANRESNLEFKITPRQIQHYKQSMQGYEKAYDNMLADINRGKVDAARIRSIRNYYPKTRDYTPFSEKVINRMTAFAYIADTNTNQIESNNALVEYKEMLDKHIINFDVLTFALTLARADVRYGDALLLNEIRQGLIKDLNRDINIGKTPKNAYTIATYGEETFILEQYGGVVKDSELFKVGRAFFNVHEVELPDGELIQIFMDVTDPIINIRLQQILRENQARTIIPGQ